MGAWNPSIGGEIPSARTDLPDSIKLPVYKGYPFLELNKEILLPFESTHEVVSTPTNHPYPHQFERVGCKKESDCREAISKYLEKKCVHGKRFGDMMTITKIQPTTVLHYGVESFAETRSVMLKIEPNTKQTQVPQTEPKLLDDPWSIDCIPEKMFHTHSKHRRIVESVQSLVYNV
ncbi:uncharacterized protein LOC141901191 [Tubulanus polymorphus]|uniref:uncharacterized protein LOC141901191 n=1 Tax=Tubulanus polymorphus TaxID=672921 RepID=UPI003DA38412